MSDSAFPDDIELTAWTIAARQVTAGQKDVTKMIADAIRQEKARCADLIRSSLGPGADHLSAFVEDPRSDWVLGSGLPSCSAGLSSSPDASSVTTDVLALESE